ncbi:MAG: hypothetical protein AB7F41_10660 [Methylocystis sp.]|uniref:hypothetical protein n=1 Tax=Methylocystis sp. TaxID=1911079 RepID=UPI003D129C31
MSVYQIDTTDHSQGGTIPKLSFPPQLAVASFVLVAALFMAFVVNANVSEQVRNSHVWIWVTVAFIAIAACIGLLSLYVARREAREEREYRDRLDKLHEEGNKKFDDLIK